MEINGSFKGRIDLLLDERMGVSDLCSQAPGRGVVCTMGKCLSSFLSFALFIKRLLPLHTKYRLFLRGVYGIRVWTWLN